METEGLSVDQSAVQLVGEEIFGFGNGQCSAGENSRRVFLIANPTADTRVVVIVLPHTVGVIIVVDIEIVIGGELGKVVGSVHTARFHIGHLEQLDKKYLSIEQKEEDLTLMISPDISKI